MPKVEISETKGLFQQSGTGLHLTVNGAAPAAAFAGGTAAGGIEAQSTDIAGIVNVTTQLTNTDTCTITFATAYDTAPAAVVAGLPNIKYVTSTTALTITGTGNTGTGELHYHVIRSV